MNVLVTGITGYIGSRLAPRLRRDGHEIRGFARGPGGGDSDANVVHGDAVSGAQLEQALDGIDVAYFLIHSMESSADGAFDVRERTAAENFARVARECKLPRVIYLGGPIPSLDRDRRRLSIVSLPGTAGRAHAGARRAGVAHAPLGADRRA